MGDKICRLNSTTIERKSATEITRGCPLEACEHCSGGTSGNKRIVLSGWADGSLCNECANIDGTYDLVHSGGTNCIWSLTGAATICGSNMNLQLDITLDGSSNKVITLSVQLLTTPQTYTFVKNTGSTADIDCDGWSNYDLPRTDGPNTTCDDDAATCKLTSL